MSGSHQVTAIAGKAEYIYRRTVLRHLPLVPFWFSPPAQPYPQRYPQMRKNIPS